MGTTDPRVGPFFTRGVNGRIYFVLFIILLNTKHMIILQDLVLIGFFGFREDDCSSIFHYGNNQIPPVHMGMLCGTYVKLHVTMLHTKYRSFGSCGFRKDFFTYFPL